MSICYFTLFLPLIGVENGFFIKKKENYATGEEGNNIEKAIFNGASYILYLKRSLK